MEWGPRALGTATTNRKNLYGLPIGRVINHLFVWKSLLEQAGFEDIPKEWGAFWSFWCDQVQPAVRAATGRDEIWGIALVMSPEPDDGVDQFFQFVAAYDADYVTRDGQLVIDDPEIRRSSGPSSRRAAPRPKARQRP
jgi:multiple sugar transport system substrate-binding protein